MRNVIFVANGKEFKTYAEARAESHYVDTVLSENYDPDYTPSKGNPRVFGTYTGKLAEDWISPGRRI